MKIFKKTALLFTLILVSVVGFAENQNTTQKTDLFDVSNMTCKSCHITVSMAIEKVDGVIDCKVDYKTKTATVTYDSSIASIEQIEMASTNAGYPAKLKGDTGE